MKEEEEREDLFLRKSLLTFFWCEYMNMCNACMWCRCVALYIPSAEREERDRQRRGKLMPPSEPLLLVVKRGEPWKRREDRKKERTGTEGRREKRKDQLLACLPYSVEQCVPNLVWVTETEGEERGQRKEGRRGERKEDFCAFLVVCASGEVLYHCGRREIPCY